MRELQRLPTDFDSDGTVKLTVSSDNLNVFDSAFSGQDFEPQHNCRFQIKAGQYTVASTLYEPHQDTGLIIHRLIRD